MTEFTEWPSLLVLVRTAIALVAFVFLPGYFIDLARQKRTDFLSLLTESPAQAIGESVITSALILGFASIALMFTIGFSELAIVIVAMGYLALTWFNWTRNLAKKR